MKQWAAIFLCLFLAVGVAVAQEQEKQTQEQTEKAKDPTAEKANEGTIQEVETAEPIPDDPKQGIQWSEMFKAWSTTHYLHIDFTHPETGEWCAVLVIDNRTQQAQCIK